MYSYPSSYSQTSYPLHNASNTSHSFSSPPNLPFSFHPSSPSPSPSPSSMHPSSPSMSSYYPSQSQHTNKINTKNYPTTYTFSSHSFPSNGPVYDSRSNSPSTHSFPPPNNHQSSGSVSGGQIISPNPKLHFTKPSGHSTNMPKNPGTVMLNTNHMKNRDKSPSTSSIAPSTNRETNRGQPLPFVQKTIVKKTSNNTTTSGSSATDRNTSASLGTTGRKCGSCNTTTSPQWRTGPFKSTYVQRSFPIPSLWWCLSILCAHAHFCLGFFSHFTQLM